MIPININLWEEAETLLPIQFYNKTNIRELLYQTINQLQISNDVIFDTMDNLNVENATGYLLDCVGSYVAVSRNADNDEAYRDRIKRKILTASSEGTPNELLSLLSTITDGETKIWEHFPVSTSMSTDGWNLPTRLAAFMQEASPATSGNIIIYLNPFKECFIPSELGFDIVKLISRELNPFVTNLAEYIVVNDLIYGGEEDQFAILSEYTYGQANGTESAIPDGKGIFCEIAYTDGGVLEYVQEYLELDNTITAWYYQMNYITPYQFN